MHIKRKVFFSFCCVMADKNRVTVLCLKLRNSLFDILRCLRYTLNLYSFSLFYSKVFQLIKSGIKYNGLCFTGKVHYFNIIAYRENIRMLQRENLLLSIFRKMVKKQWISPTVWHLWNFHRQRNELNGTNNWWNRFYFFFLQLMVMFLQNHFWFWWQFCLQAWVLTERNISFRVLIWLYILIIKWLKTNWMLNIIFSIFLYGTIQTLY